MLIRDVIHEHGQILVLGYKTIRAPSLHATRACDEHCRAAQWWLKAHRVALDVLDVLPIPAVAAWSRRS